MCGIAGIWASKRPDSGRLVGSMLREMKHRGPDSEGILDFPGGALGMVRLALVDLTEKGDQPMHAHHGLVSLVFNGEVYNFRNERRILRQRGHRFHSETDTEVVLASYLEFGPSFLSRLRGMFALAIVDRRPSHGPPSLLVARDPLGMKPLILGRTDDGSVVLASELGPLLRSGALSRTLNPEALADFLLHGFVLQPRTIIQRAEMLRPGRARRYGLDGQFQEWPFYRLPAPRHEWRDVEIAGEHLEELLEESLDLHARADDPVGALLSGGMDSTGLVSMMRARVPNLHTFTVRYGRGTGLDESMAARSTAERLETVHHDISIGDDEVGDHFRNFCRDIDQPSIDGFNTWLVAREAKRQVTGLVSGLGGDEWFSGYPVVGRMVGSKLPGQRPAATVLDLVSEHLPETIASRTSSWASYRSSTRIWLQPRSIFPAHSVARSLGIPIEEPGTRLSRTFDDIEFEGVRDEIDLAQRLDSRVYLLSQLLRDGDVCSMAHGIELRLPLVDQEIVRFARACAPSLLRTGTDGRERTYAGSGAKRVLRRAFRKHLPPGFGTRPKLGFALPMSGWLQGPLRPRSEATLTWLRECHHLDVAPITPIHPYPQLWSLMILGEWLQGLGFRDD